MSLATSANGTNTKCSDVRYLVVITGKNRRRPDIAFFVDAEAYEAGRCNNWRGTAEKKQHFVPVHNPRALICYCVRNLYVIIRATMLAKISSAARDFRIIGPVVRAAEA